jgi:hypothetical protein
MKHFPKFGNQVIIRWTDLVYFVTCFITIEMEEYKNGEETIL